MDATTKLIARNALKDTVAAHRAFTRWLKWCDGLHAAKIAAGVYEPAEYPVALSIQVEREYTAANKRPGMPSKNRKHRMYADAYRAASLAGVDTSAGIRDMAGIAEVITKVTAALAVA